MYAEVLPYTICMAHYRFVNKLITYSTTSSKKVLTGTYAILPSFG